METKIKYLDKIKKETWELDYLSYGSPIFQDRNIYTFSSDATKLSKVVNIVGNDTIVDLCAGVGIIGLEIADRAKKENKKISKIVFVELQKDTFELLSENVKINKSSEVLYAINDRIQNFGKQEKNQHKFSVVVCNPPYFKIGCGTVSSNINIAVSRHEIELTLKELFACAKNLLQTQGRFYLIHINSRSEEIERIAKSTGFEVLSKEVLPGKLQRVIYIFESVKKLAFQRFIKQKQI